MPLQRNHLEYESPLESQGIAKTNHWNPLEFNELVESAKNIKNKLKIFFIF